MHRLFHDTVLLGNKKILRHHNKTQNLVVTRHYNYAPESALWKNSSAMVADKIRGTPSKRCFHQDTTTEHTNQLRSLKSTIPRMGQGIQVGQYAFLERTYSNEDVEQFSTLALDFNPLHSSLDWEQIMVAQDDSSWDIHQENGLIQFQESNPRVTKPVVHGMLVSSIFSSMFATLSPGCIYISQSLDFLRPVFVGDTVAGRITVDRIRKWRKGGVLVQCTTKVTTQPLGETTDFGLQPEEMHSSEHVFVKGVANVWLPSGFVAQKP
ncbi:MaoC domain containing protein dehydratase [Nitzschia inconspicua]|uniref:MaoC domain containing protein dehydratase n=1 Tax=Nitzschia inconspicua TaxID=303405 RepID=A0A9K3L606_9STRA|nr:MaoC domain containing protein dehydratase [Nitzschia inconspicua]